MYLLIYFSACVCICIAARVLICSISKSVCMYVRTCFDYNRYKRGPQERSAGVGSVSLCTEDSTAIYFQQKGSHRNWFVTPLICNVYTIVPYVRIFFIYLCCCRSGSVGRVSAAEHHDDDSSHWIGCRAHYTYRKQSQGGNFRQERNSG